MRKIDAVPILFCLFFLLLSFEQSVSAGDAEGSGGASMFAPLELHGFAELRSGCRIQNDPQEKDISVMEARLQAELYTYTEQVEFKYKGDVWGDGITERIEYATREAWVFMRPTDFVDLKIGRQILTWGTGDLVFINDLFPKDWQSFFIGRDQEYLKAPSDAAKLSVFTDMANFDVVYTPKFDPDRYITGEYVSYWSGKKDGRAGNDALVVAETPDRWFKEDELAIRVYRNINNYELAFYAYRGFWKRPAGQSRSNMAVFPRLYVYGFSLRGKVGPGIGNIEYAYYDSADDKSGLNPEIDNSEMRYLLGYTQDLAKDLNLSLQYYVERLLDYDEYREGISADYARDQDRQVITLQLTQLLFNQNLELSLSAYYSPSDKDAYLRPQILYKYSDLVTLETGANIFCGEDKHTFFGQFSNNTNVYVAARYNF